VAPRAYLDIGRDQRVALDGPAEFSRDDLSSLGVLADDVEECIRLLTHRHVLGLVLSDGTRVQFRFKPKEGP